MESQELYLKVTFPEGKTSCTEHQVYDKEKFVASKVKYFSTRDKPEDNGVVNVISRQEYQRATGKKVF